MFTYLRLYKNALIEQNKRLYIKLYIYIYLHTYTYKDRVCYIQRTIFMSLTECLLSTHIYLLVLYILHAVDTVTAILNVVRNSPSSRTRHEYCC